MKIGAIAGHRIWSASYDTDANPMLALETRMLSGRLGPLSGSRFLDIAAGTGRWSAFAAAQGAHILAIDLCEPMLSIAAKKRGISGRLVIADAHRLPLSDRSADIALCSFALGYFSQLEVALREMARVAGRVILSDMHPAGEEQGWKRSFQVDGRSYELSHSQHSERNIERAANSAGLIREWSISGRFEAPEYPYFQRANKADAFVGLQQVPAVLITSWRHQ